ncbi:MAG: sulfatase [Bacteroidetes bacterium]|nr:sulfatase [Bacteroidota bacterium]
MRTALLAVLALVTVSGCADRSPDDRPNIVFIFTDDHAFQAIGAYGGRLASLNPTPNIDRLAADGMLFSRAFVTNSICAPSRAVILSGMHSHKNGVLTNVERFDSTQATFPALLQDAGYQTAMIGKWHLKAQPMGFDYWEVLPGQGKYYNPEFITVTGRHQETGYVTDLITDKALDWIGRRDPKKPFLLMFQHKAPHREWSPGPDHLSMFAGDSIPEPPTLFDDYAGRIPEAAQQEMEIDRHMDLFYDLKVRQNADSTARLYKLARANYNRMNDAQRAAWDAAYDPENEAFVDAGLTGKDLVRWKYQRYMKDYLRSVASVDDNIGRLLDYLDAQGLADNTLVVYSSDQGFYLGEHGWFDKRWMYEESMRTPLIARWPRVIPAGSVNADLVQNLDYAETFLDVAGVDPPEAMQGRSLVPLMRGDSAVAWRDALYYQYYEQPSEHNVPRHYGVRTDRYKLIHYYRLDEWELFDLDNDPNEMHSVYGDSRYASVRAELKERLQELRTQYDVPEDTRE